MRSPSSCLMLGVTGKRNAKRSSIPYLDSVCGLMWVGLPGSECPDWLVERGKEAWLQNLRFSCIRFRRDLELEVNEDGIEELIMGHEDELQIELQEILNEEQPRNTTKCVSF
ncbi:hypothetical protein TNCV_1849031 [Trichonephila clavipes]|nr:hypothetical protein TNCV_1849031 [Trichonephila clavipes]